MADDLGGGDSPDPSGGGEIAAMGQAIEETRGELITRAGGVDEFGDRLGLDGDWLHTLRANQSAAFAHGRDQQAALTAQGGDGLIDIRRFG